jgi:hypothetical protein
VKGPFEIAFTDLHAAAEARDLAKQAREDERRGFIAFGLIWLVSSFVAFTIGALVGYGCR